MEYALTLLSIEQERLRRLARKRNLSDTKAHFEADSSWSTSPHQETEKLEDAPEIDFDDNCRHHICACIVHICEKIQFLSSGKAFVARSTLGLFLAAQAVSPQPFGPVWAGLLYVCFECVSDSYSQGASSPRRTERVRTLVLTDIIRFLATTPKTLNGKAVNMSDNELVKGCRRWSRFENPALLQVVEQAWSITEIPRVRLAMEGVLSNCASAKYLFT